MKKKQSPFTRQCTLSSIDQIYDKITVQIASKFTVFSRFGTQRLLPKKMLAGERFESNEERSLLKKTILINKVKFCQKVSVVILQSFQLMC